MNMPNLSTRPYQLTLERKMTANADSLYLAWTKHLDQWFAASDSMLMEGKVNTPFFFETEFDNKRHPHYGRFIHLEENKQIIITWVTGVGGTDGAETVLTINLESLADGTKLHLTHAGFLNEEAKNSHAFSWPLVLEQLDKSVNN